MSNSDLSASGINFDAPATFRKWPSLNGQRRINSAGPKTDTTAHCLSASNSFWLGRLRCGTSTRFKRHHSHHWWAP